MKLRQKSALSLCALYLFSVIGLAISLHFCGNNLSDIRLADTAKCGMCSSEMKQVKGDHCCKNTSVAVKISDSHQTSEKVSLPKNVSLSLFFSPIISRYFAKLFPRIFGKIADEAPPGSARNALYLFNCVFRN